MLSELVETVIALLGTRWSELVENVVAILGKGWS
jgi:hypothetical protein